MNRNVLETVLGAVVLAVAALFFIFGMQKGQLGSKSGYTVSANFSEIGALKEGSDVRISGVKVGTISDLVLNPETYQAKAILAISEGVKLPTDTSARIASESLLGGDYLALLPGAEEELLGDGGTIIFTESAQNLTQLLGKFIFATQNANEAP